MIMLRERSAEDKTKIDHPTAYVAEVYEHWQEIDERYKSLPHGSHQRYLWEVQAEAAWDLYRHAKACEADDIDDVMAFRAEHDSREKTYAAWHLRAVAVDSMRDYRWRASNAVGPDAGLTATKAQAAELAILNFANRVLGEGANGISREVERAV